MGQYTSKPASQVKGSVKPEKPAYLSVEDTTYLGESFTKEKPLEARPSSPMPPPLRVKYLNHAAIEARDIDTVCAFYETILGFRRLPRPALGFPGCWLEMPGVMLHITEVDPTVPRRVENWKDLYEGDPEAWYIRRATHLAFEVEDFDEAEDRLRQHGMEYTRFVLPEVNMRQLFLYDPEGHGIEMGVYDDSRHFIKEHGDTMPSYTPSRPTDGLTD